MSSDRPPPPQAEGQAHSWTDEMSFMTVTNTPPGSTDSKNVKYQGQKSVVHHAVEEVDSRVDDDDDDDDDMPSSRLITGSQQGGAFPRAALQGLLQRLSPMEPRLSIPPYPFMGCGGFQQSLGNASFGQPSQFQQQQMAPLGGRAQASEGSIGGMPAEILWLMEQMSERANELKEMQVKLEAQFAQYAKKHSSGTPHGGISKSSKFSSVSAATNNTPTQVSPTTSNADKLDKLAEPPPKLNGSIPGAKSQDTGGHGDNSGKEAK